MIHCSVRMHTIFRSRNIEKQNFRYGIFSPCVKIEKCRMNANENVSESLIFYFFLNENCIDLVRSIYYTMDFFRFFLSARTLSEMCSTRAHEKSMQSMDLPHKIQSKWTIAAIAIFIFWNLALIQMRKEKYSENAFSFQANDKRIRKEKRTKNSRLEKSLFFVVAIDAFFLVL